MRFFQRPFSRTARPDGPAWASARQGRFHALAALPLALAAIGLLAGCGLPSNLPGLAAPGGATTNSISSNIPFFTNTVPDPSYTLLGFEVYYRLYDSSSISTGQYFTDTGQFTSPTYATPGYAPLASLGYQRLVAVSSLTSSSYPLSSNNESTWLPVGGLTNAAVATLQQVPMIPISSVGTPTSLFQVSLDFSAGTLSATSGLVKVTSTFGTSSTLYGGRLITPTTGSATGTYLKSFGSTSFDVHDPDLPVSLQSASSFTSLGVGLVVLAYGLDPNLQQVYSIPVPIGYISIAGAQIYN